MKHTINSNSGQKVTKELRWDYNPDSSACQGLKDLLRFGASAWFQIQNKKVKRKPKFVMSHLKRARIVKTVALFLSLFLSWEIPASPVTWIQPSSYLAPATLRFPEDLLREVEKARTLSRLFPEGGKFKVEGEGELTVDPGRVIERWQETKKQHFPFFFAVVNKDPAKNNPVLFLKAAEVLYEKTRSQKQVHFYIEYFLGAALYYSREKDENQNPVPDKQKMVERVETFLKTNQELIPRNGIDTNKTPYSAAEYASILEWKIIPVLASNGNLDQWNELFDEPSELPLLLDHLAKASSKEERNRVLAQIKQEYFRLNRGFKELKRGKAFPLKSLEEPFAADTVVFPKKGEKTAIPLAKGLSFEKFVKDLFSSLEKELLKHVPPERIDAVKRKIHRKKRRLIHRVSFNSHGQLVMSRQDLDEIGKALQILSQFAVLKNFAGKGTRFKVREYVNGKRVNADKAKGSYVIDMLGKRTILELDVQALNDYERTVVENFFREKKVILTKRPERLPEVIVQSHLTHGDLERIYTDPLQLLEMPFPRMQGAALLSPIKNSPVTASKYLVNTPARPLVFRKTGENLPLDESKNDWPDGHNSAFVDFFTSGVACLLTIQGFKYYYVSNGDNLVALPHPAKAAMLALTGKTLINDVAEKEPGMKGGSLIKKGRKPSRKTKSKNKLMLYEGNQMPLKFMDVLDEIVKIAKESGAKEMLEHPDFLEMAESMLGTQGLLALLKKEKGDETVIALYLKKIKSNKALKGTLETKFKLFNTANYLGDIRGILESHGISWKDYEAAVMKADKEEDFSLLQKLRRIMKSRYPIVFESDKTYAETGEKNFEDTLQTNQLAGSITGIVPQKQILYLEVPSGEKAGSESLFQPLKSNVETYVRDVYFLKTLMEENTDPEINLVDCAVPTHRILDKNFLAEFEEWTGKKVVVKEDGSVGYVAGKAHKEFEGYRGKKGKEKKLVEALKKAEEDLFKHCKELEIVNQVFSQYRQSDLNRIAIRKKNSAVILMAGGPQVRMKGEHPAKVLTRLPSGKQTLLSRILITLRLNGFGGNKDALNPIYVVNSRTSHEEIASELALEENKLGMNFEQIIGISDIEERSGFIDSLIKATRKAKEDGNEQVLVLLGDLLPDASAIGKALYSKEDVTVLLAEGRGGHTTYNPLKEFPLGFDPHTRSGFSLMGLYFPTSALAQLENTRDLSQIFPKDNTQFLTFPAPVYNLNTPEQVAETRRAFAIHPRPFGIKTDGLIPEELAQLALAEVVHNFQEYELHDISSGMRKTVFACRKQGEKEFELIVEIFSPYLDGESRYQSSLSHYLVYGYKSGRVYFYNNDLRVIVRENLTYKENRSLEYAIVSETDMTLLKSLMEQAAQYVKLLQNKDTFDEAGPLNFKELKPIGRGQPWFNESVRPIIYPYGHEPSKTFFGFLNQAVDKLTEAFTLAGFDVPPAPALPKDPTEFYWSHGTLSPGNMMFGRENGKYQIHGVSGGDMMMAAPGERDLAVFIVRMAIALNKSNVSIAQRGEHFNFLVSSFLHHYYGSNGKLTKESLERLRYFMYFNLLMEAWTLYFEKESGDLREKSDNVVLYLQLAKKLLEPDTLEIENIFSLKPGESFYSLMTTPVEENKLVEGFAITKVDMNPRIDPHKNLVMKQGDSKTINLQVYLPGAREDKKMRQNAKLQDAIVRSVHTVLEIKQGERLIKKVKFIPTDLQPDQVNLEFAAEIKDLDPGIYQWRVYVFYHPFTKNIFPNDSNVWGTLEIRAPGNHGFPVAPCLADKAASPAYSLTESAI